MEHLPKDYEDYVEDLSKDNREKMEGPGNGIKVIIKCELGQQRD